MGRFTQINEPAVNSREQLHHTFHNLLSLELSGAGVLVSLSFIQLILNG